MEVPMIGYVDNIEKITESNKNFRQVLFTGRYCQLVVMSLLAGEEIGLEVHPTVDQFFRIESGKGKVVMKGKSAAFGPGTAIIVPAGTKHNIIATTAVKLYTIYSPPNHPPDRVQKTKAQAMAEEDEHS
jgi:mannose-6-phosphate isomerase-like protein (cupin superfamily)